MPLNEEWNRGSLAFRLLETKGLIIERGTIHVPGNKRRDQCYI